MQLFFSFLIFIFHLFRGGISPIPPLWIRHCLYFIIIKMKQLTYCLFLKYSCFREHLVILMGLPFQILRNSAVLFWEMNLGKNRKILGRKYIDWLERQTTHTRGVLMKTVSVLRTWFQTFLSEWESGMLQMQYQSSHSLKYMNQCTITILLLQ